MADQITDALIDVAASTGVDVVTRRNVNASIRAVGHAYRVYSLIRPAQQLANAIRISAYTDATTIVCHELLVHFASKELARKLITSEVINYEVLAMAEDLVLSVDFAKDAPDSIHFLRAPQYVLEADLLSQDYLEHGRGLADLVAEALFRGVESYEKASELVRHSEAKQARRHYNFRRKEMWFDQLNRSLGQVLWRPVPEIGLGTSIVGEGLTYSGTYRKNDAEGYGCLEWANGTKYFGQIDNGQPCGYGGYRFSDGGRYFGYWPKHYFKNIGAYITPNRDRVIIGVGRGTFPNSYGRQIGLKGGVQSVSGFWSDGQLTQPIESMEQTNLKIAEGMSSRYTVELKAEYNNRSRMDRAHQGITDAALLSHIKCYI